jgi:hypothetical protein
VIICWIDPKWPRKDYFPKLYPSYPFTFRDYPLVNLEICVPIWHSVGLLASRLTEGLSRPVRLCQAGFSAFVEGTDHSDDSQIPYTLKSQISAAIFANSDDSIFL